MTFLRLFNPDAPSPSRRSGLTRQAVLQPLILDALHAEDGLETKRIARRLGVPANGTLSTVLRSMILAGLVEQRAGFRGYWLISSNAREGVS